MLRRLKIKIISVVIGTLLIVFTAVLLILNLSMYQASVKRTDDFMQRVVESDGLSFPPKDGRGVRPPAGMHDPFGDDKMMRAQRFFYVKVDSSGAITELNLDMMFDFSEDEAREYIASALDSGKTKDSISTFSFLLVPKSYGFILVFAERTIEMGILNEMTAISVWVVGIAGLILSAFSFVLAQWMTAPIQEAFDKQRRFVSDASHELKTPLTIIDANADVLRNEIGENIRLDHIKSQSARMNALACDLLEIAKAEESKSAAVKSEFSLSGAVLNTALEFESRAFEEGRDYSYDIAEGLRLVGDEGQIKKLVGILIDNAIKHSDMDGKIEVSLSEVAKHPCISVFNTGTGIPDIEKNKVFDRFYRSDESRARETGGYGLGLAIAKSIANTHGGGIVVTGEYGKWARFTASL